MKRWTLLTWFLLGNDGHRVRLLNAVCGRPGGVLPAADPSVSFSESDKQTGTLEHVEKQTKKK